MKESNYLQRCTCGSLKSDYSTPSEEILKITKSYFQKDANALMVTHTTNGLQYYFVVNH